MSLPIEEEWRPVPGYERTYQVSSLGRVFSHPRPGAKGGLKKVKVDVRGYLAVALMQDGVQKSHDVHRLVALAFIGPRPQGMETRHLDGDRLNPTLTNLAYGSASENAADTIAHGHHRQLLKTHCPKGHPYDERNTDHRRVRDGSSRRCRTCHRDGERARRAREAAQRAESWRSR